MAVRKTPLRKSELTVDHKTSVRLSGVRQRDTAVEVEVRRLIHRLGYRFRINNRDLPGSPDLANRSHRWAVFVHGCFWHRHAGCPRASTPKRNRNFWVQKFDANVLRDERVQTTLRQKGWRVLVVWECEVEIMPATVTRRLRRALRTA